MDAPASTSALTSAITSAITSSSPSAELRVRIAPSPTGFFHVGGARTALFNWAMAKQAGGRFVLRIEDTDAERNQEAATRGIIDALAWLGIDHHDPTFEGPYYQSQYAAQHVEAAHYLYEHGFAYYCDLTGEQLAERSKASGKLGYDGYSRDRGLEPGPGRALRFRVPEGVTVVRDLIRGDVSFDHDHLEDFVLLRGNGTPMFLLANVVDDAEMGITHVVRGDEHLANTPKQQLLWEALGHTPPVWAHVPVLVNEQRKKLSKRRDKVALEQYRDEGYLADAMVNYLMTLGWAPSGDTEIVPWDEIERQFRIDDVTHSPAFFDLKKLAAFNGDYIRMLGADQFVDACEPWIPAHFDRGIFRTMAPHVQTRVVTLAEAPAMVEFLMTDTVDIDDASWNKAMNQPWSRALLAETVAAYTALERWDADSLKEALESVAAGHELKLGKAQAPIRVAVTGRSVGPPLFESLEVLGREATIARLDAAVANLPTGHGGGHHHTE